MTDRFVQELLLTIETGLITWEDYQPWADRQIETQNTPPLWILELATEKTVSGAGKILREELVRRQALEMHWNFKDFYAACMYLLAKRKQHPWGDFLLKAGMCAEGPEAALTPESYYDLYTEYTREGSSSPLQKKQEDFVTSNISKSIEAAQEFYRQITRS